MTGAPLTYEQEIHALLYAARTAIRDLKGIFERDQREAKMTPDERRIGKQCIENFDYDLARIDKAIPLAEARRASAPSGKEVDVSELDRTLLTATLNDAADQLLSLNIVSPDEMAIAGRLMKQLRGLADALPSLLDATARVDELEKELKDCTECESDDHASLRLAEVEISRLRAQHARAVKAVEALVATSTNSPAWAAGWYAAKRELLAAFRAALAEVQS